ncbi:MAG: glycoside hydrolase family 2 TIM barrel-domain containing protein [Candidatus Ornithospirochaeta sp.]
MRKRILFNDGWVFLNNGVREDVSLPHTWNKDDGATGFEYFRGEFTYEKEFSYKKDSGKRLFIEFEGVNSSSTVSFNGVTLGTHNGGYSTFRFDVTELLKEENRIEVKVDNSPNDYVYPERADFTFYGGIYRDVYLIETDDVHFPLLSNGGPGVKVYTQVEDGTGVLSFSSECNGDECVLEIEGDEYHFPVINGVLEGRVRIDGVHLWDGKRDPYLYPLTFSLLLKGEIRDQISLKVGFRTIEIFPDKGFYLNGRSYPLRGVSKHQDREGKGNAIDRSDMMEDMDIILEEGANSIRLAHYQHNQYFYDLCDEKGILVWAEIPFITVFMEKGEENTISQMTELLSQNIHHASIFCWALSNEITLMGVNDKLIENHKKLNDLCHSFDPTRYTAMANLFLLETSSPLLSIPDIIGYNIYYGWYVGELKDNEEFLDKLHKEHPEYRVAITEYGADASINIQSPLPERGDFSEGYQALYHEHMASIISKRPWLWGTFVWNMFDFAASGRNEAGDPGKNHKGLVSFDRKTKKDAYWLYASYWKEEKFVYISGRRYKNRVESETEIKVYSNCDEVSLYIDGSLLEKKKGSHVFVFRAPISSSHKVMAISSNGERDEITINKVDTPDPSYFIPGKKVVNWFDRKDEDDDYLSLSSTLGEISRTEEGEKLVSSLMNNLQNSMAGGMGKGVKVSPEMQQMALRQPLSKILAQGGIDSESEVALNLDKALRRIKKNNEKV